MLFIESPSVAGEPEQVACIVHPLVNTGAGEPGGRALLGPHEGGHDDGEQQRDQQPGPGRAQ